MDIQVMHRQGMSIRAISRDLGVSRNTVRRYLRSRTVPVAGPRARKPSKIDPYRDYLVARVEAARPDWIPAAVLFQEIVELGYQGSVRTVSGYLATLKPAPAPDPVVRYETKPGEQMQVDWGSFKLNGERISLFLATLGWSRFNYGVFVRDEQFETLRDCHEAAFESFGGTPEQVLYDNMRTVVQQRNAYGEGLHKFHPGLLDLAGHYGFLPRLCKPYRAKTKGKVERSIGYIRRSFFVPTVSRYQQLQEPLTLDGLNLEFARWLAITANARTHGTTGEVPSERLDVEREHLQPLPPSKIMGPPVVAAADRSFSQQFPTEPLQHPLSVYDALVNV